MTDTMEPTTALRRWAKKSGHKLEQEGYVRFADRIREPLKPARPMRASRREHLYKRDRSVLTGPQRRRLIHKQNRAAKLARDRRNATKRAQRAASKEE